MKGQSWALKIIITSTHKSVAHSNKPVSIITTRDGVFCNDCKRYIWGRSVVPEYNYNK